MLRVFALLCFIPFASLAFELTGALALDDKPAEPSLEQLLAFNAHEIFGGDAVIKDGRVNIKYLGKGQFNRGFRSGSSGVTGFLSNLEEIKDHGIKTLASEGVEGAFSFAAVESGEALSKFELADDFKISFRVRLPLVPPDGSLVVRVNQADSKRFIQTSFFQDLTVVDGGRPKRKTTTEKDFFGSPSKWFFQKFAPNTATPVEIVYKEKKASVFVTLFPEKDKPTEAKKKEVVSQEGIDKLSSGKIFFKFSKMSFGVADLVIDGKYSKEWAEKEIARLRKNGKLRLTVEEPELLAKKDEKGKAKSPGGEKKGSEPERKARGGKRPPPNVDQPDPEAQVDL